MKAILVPHDLTKEITEVEGESIRHLAQEHWDHPGGKWTERVNTTTMAEYNFLMVVDDDGRDHHLPVNLRALMISQYPGGDPIVGDVLLASETRFSGGIDYIDIDPGVMKLLQESGITEMARMMVRTIYDGCPEDHDH